MYGWAAQRTPSLSVCFEQGEAFAATPLDVRRPTAFALVAFSNALCVFVGFSWFPRCCFSELFLRICWSLSLFFKTSLELRIFMIAMVSAMLFCWSCPKVFAQVSRCFLKRPLCFPMFSQWLSTGFPMIFYAFSNDAPMVFQWVSHVCSHGFPLGFLCFSHGCRMVFLILFAWLSNGFQWLSYVILMVFQCFPVFSMMSNACPLFCYVMLCYIMLNRCWNHVNIHDKLIWNLCDNHVKSLLNSR